MKRHQALIPLSHQHHHALAQARRLRLAAKTDDESRLGATEAFLGFFRDDTLSHFHEEEEEIFPLAVGYEEARPTLERVMIEHLQIHSLVRTLHEQVDDGLVREEHMTRLAETLAAHVRFEEKAVFPLIERLATETLDDISSRSS